jgi:hypothetical protein
MSEKQTILFFFIYGILLVGIIIYYWRWSLRKGREDFKKEHPELYRLNNDNTLTDLQREILFIQMLKRDNNRMAMKLAYNNSLSYEQREFLNKYIKENEEFIMKKRKELINQNKDE